MNNRLQGVILAGAAVFVVHALVSRPVVAQTAGAEVPRAWDGHPDLNGVWQAIGTAHWDIQDHTASSGHPDLGAIGAVPPGQGVVVGNEIPYQDWALEQKQTNLENRLSADPEAKCFMPGVPRATYLPIPFRSFRATERSCSSTGSQKRVVRFTWTRTIQNRRRSTAGWDVLTVGGTETLWSLTSPDSTARPGSTVRGNFASNTLRVVERYTPMGPDAIMYEATIEDPNVFTRPWTMKMPLYRRLEENARVLEFKCVEFL